MKIKIAYLPEEEYDARRVARMVCFQMEAARCKERVTHPPFRHIYIETKSRKRPLQLQANIVK